MMRVFYAIELSNEIKNFIYQKQQLIKDESIKGNFSRKENFHITLKFIGEIEITQLEHLKQSLDKAIIGITPLQLKINKVGYFSRGNRLIVWLGIKNNNELIKLYNNLQGILYENSYSIDRCIYKPHITIGRQVQMKIKKEEIQNMIHIEPIKICVNNISLMESTRVNGLLTYVQLYSKKII